MKYSVYISKEYFPPGTQQEKFRFTDVWEQLYIKATSRREAAALAWSANGTRWLYSMNKLGKGRIIVSLYVNDPKAGVTGIAGRLPAIKVYDSLMA
jgi:hypothetical protein